MIFWIYFQRFKLYWACFSVDCAFWVTVTLWMSLTSIKNRLSFNFSHLLFCYKILCPLSKVINQVTFLCVTWVIWSLYSCLMSDERKLLFCYLFFYISTQFKKYTGRHYSCEKSFGKWLIFCLPVLTKIGESAEMITVITGLCWDEDVQQDRVVFGCCAAQYRQNKDLVLEMNQSCSDFID